MSPPDGVARFLLWGKKKQKQQQRCREELKEEEASPVAAAASFGRKIRKVSPMGNIALARCSLAHSLHSFLLLRSFPLLFPFSKQQKDPSYKNSGSPESWNISTTKLLLPMRAGFSFDFELPELTQETGSWAWGNWLASEIASYLWSGKAEAERQPQPKLKSRGHPCLFRAKIPKAILSWGF